jgi:hypothetical protein
MAAPLFPVNTHRYDPYRTFKFQVLIDGQPVAGLSKMSALKKTTDVVDWRTAGDPSHQRKLPGGTKYEAITLEQGLTHDPGFEQCNNLVNNIDGDGAVSLLNYRKHRRQRVQPAGLGCPVLQGLSRLGVGFQALPSDAHTANAVGIQHKNRERRMAARCCGA